jgi:hypothetical protein
MRAAIAFAVVFASTAAYADRSTTLELGVGLDARNRADSFGDALSGDAHYRGTGRLTLAFEPARSQRIELHLVPELFAGFAANDRDAEGSLGVGLRAELFGATANPRIAGHGAYLALRGEVMGPNRDPALEIAVGHFIERWNGFRFGYDTALVFRERDDVSADRSRELDVIFSLVIGQR